MFKNRANQKVEVFAYATDAHASLDAGDPVTGDASNITAQLSLDCGTAAATDDTNPTELDATDHPGTYYFDLLQAETNAFSLQLTPVSSTTGVLIEPHYIRTRPAPLMTIVDAATGQSLYCLFFNDQGQVWNGSSFESYNVSNWGTYDVAMTEVGSIGRYAVNIPDPNATNYEVFVGASPASSDPRIAGGRTY